MKINFPRKNGKIHNWSSIIFILIKLINNLKLMEFICYLFYLFFEKYIGKWWKSRKEKAIKSGN
jgi:hypothetical protein